MIIYNTTYHVDDKIHAEYLSFVREVFIPQIVGTGILKEARLSRIVDDRNEPGASYSLQFRVENVETLTNWLNEHGEKLNDELFSQFGHGLAGFVTLLEEID